ncbi:YkgJ family cysteine cluster protein [Acidaminobacter hydrogenoformans]|uniref:Putative zinc-or iron-chelating domain-containing protein n=1 Tax=Acidaminobacter hydrogenoformans DSM 2784 TaxID=1120920 RepID=A0A1G5RYE0_9FIRM|nr:YkgJ family cysteine cluster protein [Acidaminobacter hydrogenoformans]SCZ79112.1 Putative zinc-or iron-chelating domain-containing protein [Acidaminobacter hydrogenoformans DSM 2784]
MRADGIAGDTEVRFLDPLVGDCWERAFHHAGENGLFERLLTVYNKVPGGKCSGCTACCAESVSTFFVEWLRIRDFLVKGGRWAEALRRAEAFAFDELARPMKCPMLEADGRCMIYEVRPLTCRIFGHLQAADYGRNLKAVLKANRRAADQILKHHGVVLPTAVVEKAIPYCESFISEAPMSSGERDALFDDLFSMDSRFLMAGLLEPDQIQLGLVDWFAMVRLEPEALAEERLRRAAAGSSGNAAAAETLD